MLRKLQRQASLNLYEVNGGLQTLFDDFTRLRPENSFRYHEILQLRNDSGFRRELLRQNTILNEPVDLIINSQVNPGAMPVRTNLPFRSAL